MQMLVLEQEGSDRLPAISSALQERLQEMKQKNPRGYLDQWDSQIDNICMDIAQSMGGGYTYRDGCDHVLVFFFPPMSIEGVERHLDKHPELWNDVVLSH